MVSCKKNELDGSNVPCYIAISDTSPRRPQKERKGPSSGEEKTHQHGYVLGDLQDLAPVNDRLLKLRPLQAEQSRDYRVRDELGIIAKLRARERGDALDEQLARAFRVPHEQKRQRLIHAQTIAPVPVPALRDGPRRDRERVAVPAKVAPEGAHAGHLEVGVESLPRAQLRQRQYRAIRVHGVVLRAAPRLVPRNVHHRRQDLHVPGLVRRPRHGRVKRNEDRFVMR